jgi:hypothetical protein
LPGAASNLKPLTGSPHQEIAALRTAKKVESITLKPDQPFKDILFTKKRLTASKYSGHIGV